MATIGTNTVFKLADSGSTLRDLSAYLKESGFTREIDALDVTTFGDTKREYIAGLEDGTISLGGVWDATVDGYLAGLIRSAPTTWEYYPDGNSTGKVKYTGQCILTSYEIESPLDEVTMFSAELQQSGAITRSIVS